MLIMTSSDHAKRVADELALEDRHTTRYPFTAEQLHALHLARIVGAMVPSKEEREKIRLASTCRCDHVRGAHAGDDNLGPCEAKACRKWLVCQGFRSKA
jgi:hypothetical protein